MKANTGNHPKKLSNSKTKDLKKGIKKRVVRKKPVLMDSKILHIKPEFSGLRLPSVAPLAKDDRKLTLPDTARILRKNSHPVIQSERGRVSPRSLRGHTGMERSGMISGLAWGGSFVLIGVIFFMVRGSSNPHAESSLTQSSLPAGQVEVQSGAQPENQIKAPINAVAQPVATNPQREVTMGDDSLLIDEFRKVNHLKFSKKISFWSAYIEKNLEGRQKLLSFFAGRSVDDSAPLIPQDYNCTTFVETVIALARSKTPAEIEKNLIAVRYREGRPGFETRNHFPEADWLPNNEKVKILTDVTGMLAHQGGVNALVQSKIIDRGKWLREQILHDTQHGMTARSLAEKVSDQWNTPTRVEVRYVPIHKIKQVLLQIPSGTILNLVHKDDGVHPVLITHQGFVVRENGRILLRHASIGGRIRTNDLYSYLVHLEHQQGKHTHWPLIGVNLIQINDSASASSRLKDSI